VIYPWNEFPELGSNFGDENYSIWTTVTSSIELTNGNTKKYISYYCKNNLIKDTYFYNYNNKYRVSYNGTIQTSDTTLDKNDPVEVFITSPNKLIVSKNINNTSTNLTIE
jgi:hypothetical protein